MIMYLIFVKLMKYFIEKIMVDVIIFDLLFFD